METSGSDIVALSTGPGFVCLDAMVPIHFNRVGHLELLGNWFGPRVFTANVIMEEEIRGALDRHPANRAILDSDWLVSVPVDVIEDIALVASLRRRWGSKDYKDRGEAEVVALCRRYGWTAIMDDEVGRKAAKDNRVPCVYMLTAIVAAASCDLITRQEAWSLHCSIARAQKGSMLTAQDCHRPVFMDCVDRFVRIGEKRGNPRWPGILASKGLDDVIIWTRNYA
jgi:predicted nucleic acid-binding protein